MSGDGAPLPAGIEAVLFDLDGTLVDADAVWRGAIARTLAPCYERYPALRTLGSPEAIYDSVLWPLAAERGAAVGGEWDDEFMRHALREFLAEHAERDDGYADELLSQYARERARGTYQRYADAVPALETLLGRYRLGLITNGPGEHQRSRIEPLGLDRYFEAIAVSGELGVRKPDPAIFRHVLAALSVTAAASVYVGDSLEADVAGARAAGMAAVWLNRDGRAVAGDHEPDAEIATLAELPWLLGIE